MNVADLYPNIKSELIFGQISIFIYSVLAGLFKKIKQEKEKLTQYEPLKILNASK